MRKGLFTPDALRCVRCVASFSAATYRNMPHDAAMHRIQCERTLASTGNGEKLSVKSPSRSGQSRLSNVSDALLSLKTVISQANGSHVGKVYTAVCLFVFPDHISKKTIQLGSPNLTHKCSTTILVSFKSSKVCVGFQTECNIPTVAYVNHSGFSRRGVFALLWIAGFSISCFDKMALV